MTITQFDRKKTRHIKSKPLLPFHTATLVLLALVTLSAIIVWAWFAGEGTINGIFDQIHIFQQNPPMWLEVYFWVKK